MEDLLAKMDPEKKRRLLNAAMKEFGENRFEKASTNVIVREAGISKGLLYHYFKSKDELYDYLFDYAMNAVAKPIAEEIGNKDSDIIRRIERITNLKMQIIHELPSLMIFSKTMYAGMDYEQVKAIIGKYSPIPVEMYYRSNIDESLFKEGIDIQTAITVIQYTLEKVGDHFMMQRNMGMEPDMAVIEDQIKSMLNHFRQVYYRKA